MRLPIKSKCMVMTNIWINMQTLCLNVSMLINLLVIRFISDIWYQVIMITKFTRPSFIHMLIGCFVRQLIIITTWRSITCRIAITFEGVENPYLPGNVHFQYRPLGDIGVAVVAGAIRNASRWLDERITWCPLFGGVLSQVRAQAREDLSTCFVTSGGCHSQ